MEDKIPQDGVSIAAEDTQPAPNGCDCGNGSCTHNALTKHYVNDEIALAFLLALTPMVVLTFFGQVGLL